MGCMSTLKRNLCVQVFVFLIIFIVDFADLLSDWLFFNDMRLQEKGLVFGPIEKKLLYVLLAFSCVGVITFFVEILNFGREIFQPDEEGWIDVDYLSTVVVWFEEIPQIAISVIIAACREEGVSIFQISKASIVIVGCLGRLFIAIIRFCLRKRRGEYRSKQSFKCCSGFLLFGLILSLIGSSLVFVFSHIVRDGSEITLQKPKEFILNQRDTSKYYPHVGIFLNSNDLRNGLDQVFQRDQWIKLMSLTGLEKSPRPAQKIRYSKSGNMKIQITTSLSQDYGPVTKQTLRTECYNETNGWFVSNTTVCQNLFGTNEATAETVIYFNFESQSAHLIMGDVKYNTRYTLNGECYNDPSINNSKLDLKYFKTVEDTEDRYHLLLPNGKVFKTLFKFYTLENLIPIKSAWKTGFLSCESSGSDAPHWDTSIKVKCFNS